MPPLPFGQFNRSDTPPVDIEEEKVVMDPKTPSDFALHAVFIRFVTLAERMIDTFLRHPLVSIILFPLDPNLNFDICRIRILSSLSLWALELMSSSMKSFVPSDS